MATNAWTVEANTSVSGNEMASIVNFGGDIYGLTETGSLYLWDGVSAWTYRTNRSDLAGSRLTVDASDTYICALGYGSGTSTLLYSTGGAFATLGGFSVARYIGRMCKLLDDGKIYYGGSELYTASPTTLLSSSGAAFGDLVMLGGEVYAAGGGSLNKLNTGTGAWDTVASSFVISSIKRLAVCGGSIFAVGNSGYLQKWNGVDAWTVAALPVAGHDRFYSLISYDETVYAGSGSSGLLLKWDGVSAWDVVISSGVAGEYDIHDLIVIGSKMYAGSGGNANLLSVNVPISVSLTEDAESDASIEFYTPNSVVASGALSADTYEFLNLGTLVEEGAAAGDSYVIWTPNAFLTEGAEASDTMVIWTPNAENVEEAISTATIDPEVDYQVELTESAEAGATIDAQHNVVISSTGVSTEHLLQNTPAASLDVIYDDFKATTYAQFDIGDIDISVLGGARADFTIGDIDATVTIEETTVASVEFTIGDITVEALCGAIADFTIGDIDIEVDANIAYPVTSEFTLDGPDISASAISQLLAEIGFTLDGPIFSINAISVPKIDIDISVGSIDIQSSAMSVGPVAIAFTLEDIDVDANSYSDVDADVSFEISGLDIDIMAHQTLLSGHNNCPLQYGG